MAYLYPYRSGEGRDREGERRQARAQAEIDAAPKLNHLLVGIAPEGTACAWRK